MKRSIKKLALAAVLTGGLVIGFTSAAFARGGGHGGPDVFKQLDGMSEQQRLEFLENKLDERLARMTKHLDLTKDQQGKVRQVMADAQTQLLEIYDKNKNAEDKTVARGEAKAVMKQARQDVGDLLTDDQKAKMKEQRGRHHEGKGPRHGKGKMLERLDEKLDLSDTQRAKVEKILEGSRTKMEALRDEPGEKTAKRARGKQILEGAADDINKVLTKDQQAKFSAMREKMKQRGEEHGAKRGKKRGAF